MIPSTRKRIFILFCIVSGIGLLIRFFLFNDTLRMIQSKYRNSPGLPVLVTVFYESLCPDSRHFFTKQLLPAYKQAAELMDIQLVPFGKATTTQNSDGTFSFDCQHGKNECYGNMYHACVIEAIDDPETRLDVVVCMIRDNRSPKEAMQKCAKASNIENIDLIQKCFDSSHGGELLKLNGDATHALRPAMTFVPTITLDGSQGNQASLLKNLLTEICKIAAGTPSAEQICKN